MSLSIYRSAFPGFIEMLVNMSNWLDKAAAQKPEAELLDLRLAPDMFPLVVQYKIASDSAKGAGERLSGTTAPEQAAEDKSFADIKARLESTIAFLKALDPAVIDGSAEKDVELKFPNGGGMRYKGLTYLTGFAVPNFYFHAMAAYANFRAAGIDIGKMDYLAHLAPYVFAPEA